MQSTDQCKEDRVNNSNHTCNIDVSVTQSSKWQWQLRLCSVDMHTHSDTSNVTTITEVRSTSFTLVLLLHAHHIVANSLIFSSPGVIGYNFPFHVHILCIPYWHCTGQKHYSSIYAGTKRLFAGMWRTLASVITTLYYFAKIIFHYPVWYRALSLHYACIQNPGMILIP